MRIVAVVLLVVSILAGVAGVAVTSSLAYAGSGNFTSTADDGWLHDFSETYTTVWNSSVAVSKGIIQSFMWIGDIKTEVYSIYRGYLFFDTSDIPSLSTITSATLYIMPTDVDTGFNITIQNGQPTYPHIPLAYNDYNRQYYGNTSGGSINTSALTAYTYTGIPLNATGISWINKDGYTKFCIRSSNDIVGIAPPYDRCVRIRTNESATPPYLSITWEASANPIATTLPATYVSMTSAQLNSILTSDGGGECYTIFGWNKVGEAFAENFSTLWYNQSTGDTQTYILSGLTPDTEYECAYFAENSHGNNILSYNTVTFTTSASCGNISNMQAIPSACYINLSWTKPGDCQDAILRYSADGCLTDNTSGSEIYNGSASSYQLTGLNPGTTYYFALWGYSGGYWGNMSDCFYTTTLAGSCTTGGPDEPTTPSTWWGSPDYERWDGLPWYNLINMLCDTVSLPYATGWMLMMIFFIVVTGLLAYALSHNLALAGGLVLIFTILGAVFELLPLWIAVVFGITALGFCWKEFR